jgi:hypothetical protein
MIKIFLKIIRKEFDHTKELEADVNKFLADQPGATTIQWLQSSGAAGGVNDRELATTITAIITY